VSLIIREKFNESVFKRAFNMIWSYI